MRTELIRGAFACWILLALCARPAEVPDRVVVLTFDDASASHAAFVAPLLKKHGFGGTFFICEFPPDFETDKTKYMTWEQIRGLHEMGFEIANHTRTHTHVNRQTRDQLAAELQFIEDRCRSNGIPRPVSFAYPAYATNAMSIELLAERGYRFGRVGGARAYDPTRDNPLTIPSFSTTGIDTNRVMAAMKEARDGRIAVFTVHGVPDLAHPKVTTPPEIFTGYIEFLASNRYTVISLRDLDRYCTPPRKP